jgi:predicted peptidase
LEIVENKDGALEYLLAVPNSTDERLHPALIFLHGYDEGVPTALRIGLTRHGPLRAGNNVPALSEFVVIAPQLPTRGDVWHRYADHLTSVLDQVAAQYPLDRKRLYLTGFSYGGNGVFDLAEQQPQQWAALWPVDPTRVPHPALTAPIWLCLGEIARCRKRAYIDTLGLQPAYPNTTGDAVYDDRGADHVGSARLAYSDPQIYRWLLSKSRL